MNQVLEAQGTGTEPDQALTSTGASTPTSSASSASSASVMPTGAAPVVWPVPVRPVLFGVLAGLALLVFYLGIITIAQDWSHALQQLAEDIWFVGAIIVGFGTQVGLFAYLRALNAKAMAGGVAASTGTSAVAMLACCAHHLADVLPIVGLSGAALFLDAYKTPLLWLGIIMNVVGIIYLARKIRGQRKVLVQGPIQACHS